MILMTVMLNVGHHRVTSRRNQLDANRLQLGHICSDPLSTRLTAPTERVFRWSLLGVAVLLLLYYKQTDR